ncbi:MAG: permease-like cell division protein FtsX [Candidatus Moraniibacteriota bacterium]
MQKSLKLWRTFKEGLTNFRRNGWLSFATISILSLSLFILAMAFLITVGTREIVRNLETKINITVSFNPDVIEEKILSVKEKLGHFREISSVEYISRDAALSDFLEQSGDDPVIRQAIDEIGENPLLASLVIRANDQGDYEKIAKVLSESEYKTDISRINYEKNKRIFERLNKINAASKKIGLIFGLVFALIAVLITFNTVRITIYSHRQEFEIMRLVGASNLYVRMPFVFEGILYGLFASVFTLVGLGIATWFMAGMTTGAFPQGNLFNLYLSELPFLSLGVLVIGVGLGVISSFIAIRRYLKI